MHDKYYALECEPHFLVEKQQRRIHMNYDYIDWAISFLREVYIKIDKNDLITFISPNCSNLLTYSKQNLFFCKR